MTQRRVLITGGGSGLGRGLAQRYARGGGRVAVVDLIGERARSVCAELPGQGHLAFTADVGSDESMQALFEAVQAQWGGVDVLINNAGIASGGSMLETTMAEWDRVLNVDLLSVVRGCRLFLPGMVAQGRGQVLNTASFAGLAGAPGMMTYGVAKAGVVALSEQLRAEMHGKGVKVGVICPAFFKTNLCETAIGSARMAQIAQKMMERAPDTVDSVSDAVHAAAERGEFMIIPTRHEPMSWRIKRWFPDYYFRQLLKRVAARTAEFNAKAAP
jgi:NAD(P)-dependent dehydrogenase (short-subunit alcohol dehydrogenase family)